MKAISPMVAVILLIAFTVAIGGILSIWLPGLVRIMAGPAEAAAEKVVRCAPAWISVEEVSKTKNRIIASNPSTLDISNIKITIDGNEIIPNTTDLKKLEAGEADTYDNTSTNYENGKAVYIGNNTTVVLRGLCLEEVPKEGRCSQGDVCWKV